MHDDNHGRTLVQRCGDLWEPVADESKRMQHGYVGVEHLFNALARQQGGLVERVLRAAGMAPAAVRDAIRRESGTGAASTVGEAPLTARLVDVLDHPHPPRPETE